jgi:hypothetical protein
MVFISFAMIMAFCGEKSSPWLIFVLWLFVYCGFVARYQLEIRNKPFAFCLPRHCTISSNTLLVINLIWSLLLGISAGLTKTADPMEQLYFGVIIFSCSGILFWVAAFLSCAAEVFSRMSFLLIAFTPFFGRHTSGWDSSFLLYPEVVVGLVIVWGLVSYLTWRFCGSRHIDRKFCGINYVGLSTAFHTKQIRKLKQKRFDGIVESVDKTVDSLGFIFLEIIRKCRSMPIYAIISGMVYQSVGPVILVTLKNRGLNLLAFLGMACVFGYYPEQMLDFMVWIILAMIFSGFDLQVHSTLLLIRGRMERYVSTIVSLLIQIAVGLGLIFLIFMGMRFLAMIMPVIHFDRQNFPFHAFNWQLWPIFAGVVPVMIMLRLLFGNKPALLAVFCGALFPFLMVVMRYESFRFFMQNYAGLLLVFIWAVFAVYLYRVCFYKDLGTGRN